MSRRPPAVRRTDVIRRAQTVPPDFASALRLLRATRDTRYPSVLYDAMAEGWTAQALGNAMGITREGVLQQVTRPGANLGSVGIDIPAPPTRIPEAPKPRPPTIPTETIERIRALQAVACRVKGKTPLDHPGRAASMQLNAELLALIDQGFSINAIERAAGVYRQVFRWRLGRHGYRALPPSLEHQRLSPDRWSEAS